MVAVVFTAKLLVIFLYRKKSTRIIVLKKFIQTSLFITHCLVTINSNTDKVPFFLIQLMQWTDECFAPHINTHFSGALV